MLLHSSAQGTHPIMSEPRTQSRRGGWASLPRDLLALCFSTANQQLHAGGAVGFAEAAGALASASPCRYWREVALEEVS